MTAYINQIFRTIASNISRLAGSPITFIIAVLLIVIWAICGRFFDYSDTWQLVINTSTTIITFLMVFLIQNTQNRDSRAMHLKLDELIRVEKGARNGMMSVEEISDEDLEKLQEEFRELHEKYETALKKRKTTAKSKSE
jgi:low affinity Fe/Cu permease